MTPPTSWLMVWTRGDGVCRVALDEAPLIDAAVTTYVDSGRHRDAVLHVAAAHGGTYRVLASEITSWMESTPATRAEEREIEALLAAERPEWEQPA